MDGRARSARTRAGKQMPKRARNVQVRRAWLVVCVGMAAVGLGGCASFPFFGGGSREISAPPPEPPTLDRESYVIGPDDVVQVVVWRNPELSVTVPVRPDGRISVPLVDDVQAAGLTTGELKLVLSEKLEEFVKSPEVTVIVAEINSKRI